MSIMQKLHDSEINCSIALFFDGCWTWKLGDDMNGFIEQGGATSFDEAEAALADAARAAYPNSLFATGVLPTTSATPKP